MSTTNQFFTICKKCGAVNLVTQKGHLFDNMTCSKCKNEKMLRVHESMVDIVSALMRNDYRPFDSFEGSTEFNVHDNKFTQEGVEVIKVHGPYVCMSVTEDQKEKIKRAICKYDENHRDSILAQTIINISQRDRENIAEEDIGRTNVRLTFKAYSYPTSYPTRVYTKPFIYDSVELKEKIEKAREDMKEFIEEYLC